MWFAFAAGSAFFAGITSILAKCGIKKTDSDVATAIRTVVVLIFAWLMVAVTGTVGNIKDISAKTLVFLILSGVATGASWLCYFKALQLGDINKVVPIDKSSTVLTILLAFIILGEDITVWKLLGMIGIGVGTVLMIQKKESRERNCSGEKESRERNCGSEKESGERNCGGRKIMGKSWLFYAVLSAVFASLTSILGKIGISGVDSNLGTAIRTIVVLFMAWLLVFVKGKQTELKNLHKKELLFIIMSGFATGASWLCYYRALQTGPASVIVPVDKLSILVSIAFSYVVFKEKLTKRACAGLAAIVSGTLIMLL